MISRKFSLLSKHEGVIDEGLKPLDSVTDFTGNFF